MAFFGVFGGLAGGCEITEDSYIERKFIQEIGFFDVFDPFLTLFWPFLAFFGLFWRIFGRFLRLAGSPLRK